jgi:prevent-host-death family protein
MTLIVNVHEAKTHLSRLLDEVHAGAEIILAKAGKPYARLVPLAGSGPARVPGRLKGQIDTSRFFEPLPDDELAAWDGR